MAAVSTALLTFLKDGDHLVRTLVRVSRRLAFSCSPGGAQPAVHRHAHLSKPGGQSIRDRGHVGEPWLPDGRLQERGEEKHEGESDDLHVKIRAIVGSLWRNAMQPAHDKAGCCGLRKTRSGVEPDHHGGFHLHAALCVEANQAWNRRLDSQRVSSKQSHESR